MNDSMRVDTILVSPTSVKAFRSEGKDVVGGRP
jgi:hypothetical protein